MIKMKQQLDKEWVHLILTAKQMGLSLEEIRNFFKQFTKKKS